MWRKRENLKCIIFLTLCTVTNVFAQIDDPQLKRSIIQRINDLYIRPDGSGVRVESELNKPIDSMFQDLDEYSYIFSIQDIKKAGIGVNITEKGDSVYLYPYPKSPADSAGIKPGDILLTVEDDELKDLSEQAIVKKLKGADGSTVKLKVSSKGIEKTMLIVRKLFNVAEISVPLLYNGIGYIKINSFHGIIEKSFKSAIDSMMNEDCKKLIIDLRDCPGGLLSSVIEITKLFIPKDSQICMVKNKKGNINPGCQNSKTLKYKQYRIPLVIIVNKRTTRGAELMAKVLQDNERALIVGQPTDGLGAIQTVFPINDTLGFKLTTGYLYLPKSGGLEKNGICPDIAVQNPEDNPITNITTIDELKNAMDGSDIYLKMSYEALIK